MSEFINCFAGLTGLYQESFLSKITFNSSHKGKSGNVTRWKIHQINEAKRKKEQTKTDFVTVLHIPSSEVKNYLSTSLTSRSQLIFNLKNVVLFVLLM